MEEIKRVLRIAVIFWVLFGALGYSVIGTLELFFFITLLLLWGYVQFDFKGAWKHFITVLLVWNILEESSILAGTQFIDGTTIVLMVLIGLSYGFYKKSVSSSAGTIAG